VRVEGSRQGPGEKDPSLAGNTLREERLMVPGQTAADLLRGQPGVAVRESTGFGGLSTASIRGATSAQTPVYLAGIRINDDVGGTADLSQVPLWLMSRVEIYRSGAPIQADTQGIGGAIFFEPKRSQGSRRALSLTLGSFGTRSLWSVTGHGDARSSTTLGVRVDQADNDYSYIDDRGTGADTSDDVERRRKNADVNMLDAWILHTTRVGKTASIDGGLNVQSRNQGFPTLSLFGTEDARVQYRRELAFVRARAACGQRCEVSATTSLILSQARYTDPRAEAALGGYRSSVDGRRVEETLRLTTRVTDRIDVTPQVRGAAESIGTQVDTTRDADALRLVGRGALGARATLTDDLTVTALVAGEQHTSRGGSGTVPAPTTQAVSGRAGAQYRASDSLSFLGNVGRYVRVPTLGELYGVSGFVRGNNALGAEASLMADLGLRANVAPTQNAPLRQANIDAFVFARQADELIAYAISGLGYVRPYNGGQARFLGAEVLASVVPLRGLTLETTVTLLDARSVGATGNDVIPFQSRLVLAPRVQYEHKFDGHTLRAARAYALYTYQSSRYADAAGLVVVPAQGVLDLFAEAQLWGDALALRARLSNVNDERRFDIVGYPLPGRALFVTAEAKW
jgi:iron complex outermembrane receptor protein